MTATRERSGEEPVRPDDRRRACPDRARRLEIEAEVADVEPDADERHHHQRHRQAERAPTPNRSSRHVRREGDECSPEQGGADRGPDLRRAEAELRSGEHRRDGEGERADPDREEPAGQKQVHGTPFDQESGRGEHRDHRGHHGHRGVEGDARIRERVTVEAAREEEQHGAGSEHDHEDELADEPRAIPLGRTSLHIPLIGRRQAADEWGDGEHPDR